GGGDYVHSLNHFATDGYRAHSRAERTLFNGKVNFARGDTRLTVVANALSAPDALDPLGLDRAQFESDPRQAIDAALRFNTRKSVSQGQIGATLAHAIGERVRCACSPTPASARPRSSSRSPWPRRPIRSAAVAWLTCRHRTPAWTRAGRGRRRSRSGRSRSSPASDQIASSRIDMATRTSSARSWACAVRC